MADGRNFFGRELSDEMRLRDAEAKGLGAFDLDGEMIDRPVLLRARGLLAREESIARRGDKGARSDHF